MLNLTQTQQEAFKKRFYKLKQEADDIEKATQSLEHKITKLDPAIGFHSTALDGNSIIIDSQTAITLNKYLKGEKLQSGEEALIKQL